MSTLSITLPSHTFITNGKHITFRAPCNSNGITGLMINDDKQVYALKDSRNRALSEDVTVFNKGVMVHVILDVDNHIAYIQTVGGSVESEGVNGVVDFNGRQGSVEPMAGDYTAEMVGASPTKHASQHMSGGNDPITPEDIGAATATHNHAGIYSLVEHNHNDAYAPKQHTHKLIEIEGLDQGGSGDLQAISDLQEDVKKLQEDMDNHTHTLSEIGAASAGHTHTASEIGASVVGHSHTATDVTGLSKVATSGSYNDLSDRPTTFAPSSHSHSIDDVTNWTSKITCGAIGALDKSTADTYYSGVNHSHTEYITPSEVDTKIAAAIAAIPVYRGE